MLLRTVARILLNRLGFMNNGKTVTGIISLILGMALYGLQQIGIAPAEPTEGAKQIVDMLVGFFGYAGGGLTLIGLGHKMGKVENGTI